MNPAQKKLAEFMKNHPLKQINERWASKGNSGYYLDQFNKSLSQMSMWASLGQEDRFDKEAAKAESIWMEFRKRGLLFVDAVVYQIKKHIYDIEGSIAKMEDSRHFIQERIDDLKTQIEQLEEKLPGIENDLRDCEKDLVDLECDLQEIQRNPEKTIGTGHIKLRFKMPIGTTPPTAEASLYCQLMGFSMPNHIPEPVVVGKSSKKQKTQQPDWNETEVCTTYTNNSLDD